MFNIFKRNKPHGTTIDEIAERSLRSTGRGGLFGCLMYGGGSGYTSDKALNLSAVYRAVEIISDSVAQLPLETYIIDTNGYKVKDINSQIFGIINSRPNARMSRFTFIKMLVTSMLLRGNGYAYIMRDEEGKPQQLIFVPSELVTVIPSQYLNDPIKYSVAGVNGEVEAKDMIHLLNFSYNGIEGVSTIRHAATSLGLASDAENHAKGFFSGGCAIGGTLTVNSSLTDKQKRDLKESWQAAFNPQTGRPNSVAILEGNMSYSPIGVDPTDSQLLETRQFSVVEIARWFGVSPVKLFDLSKSSYSTVEATNLSFLTDTLAPILAKIEQEFERKLFATDEHRDVKFNVETLLRADANSRSNYYRNLFNIGVMTVNEIRKELDLQPIEEGDNSFVPCNLMTLTNAAKNAPANSAIINPIADNNEPI